MSSLISAPEVNTPFIDEIALSFPTKVETIPSVKFLHEQDARAVEKFSFTNLAEKFTKAISVGRNMDGAKVSINTGSQLNNELRKMIDLDKTEILGLKDLVKKVGHKDYGSLTQIDIVDSSSAERKTERRYIVIGGIQGDASHMSTPCKGNGYDELKKDGKAVNGIMVALLQGNEKAGDNGASVASLNWPEIAENSSETMALSLFLAAKQMSADGKGVSLLGHSLGGIAISDTLGVLSQYGLLDKFLGYLGQDAKVIIAQSPMHLKTGMSQADFLLNRLVVNKGKDLLLGIKAITQMDSEIRKEKTSELIRAVVSGDQKYLMNALNESQTRALQREMTSDGMGLLINPIAFFGKMLEEGFRFKNPLATMMSEKFRNMGESAASYLSGMGMLRINKADRFHGRNIYLGNVDLRNEIKFNDVTKKLVDQMGIKIELVYGTRDQDVGLDQLFVAYRRLIGLGENIRMNVIGNFNHFDFGNVATSKDILTAVNTPRVNGSHTERTFGNHFIFQMSGLNPDQQRGQSFKSFVGSLEQALQFDKGLYRPKNIV